MPHLRSVGFSGSFPYLRRITDEGVDLVSFQFDRHGGAFTIEIAKCLPSGIEHPSLGHIPAVKAIAQHRHARYRKRLGHPSWFSFASSDAAAVAEAALKYLSDPMKPRLHPPKPRAKSIRSEWVCQREYRLFLGRNFLSREGWQATKRRGRTPLLTHVTTVN